MDAVERCVKLSTCCLAGLVYDLDTELPPKCGMCRKVTAVRRLRMQDTPVEGDASIVSATTASADSPPHWYSRLSNE